MDFCNKSINQSIKELNSDLYCGLDKSNYSLSRNKFGINKLSEKKKHSFFKRLISALSEPMLVILMFGFFIALGSNIGKQLATGDGDFLECFGILFAVILSVAITLIMEGSSQRAFDALNKIYDNIAVRIIRYGKMMTVSQMDLAVGDIVILESGDKIVADGRLVETNGLYTNESALTGESTSVEKNENLIFPISTPLAERKNCVYSGTFVSGGTGKMIVTAIGDNTEIGHIAKELKKNQQNNSPLNDKLNKLGKTVTIIGAISAVFIFILNITRLVINGNFSFDNLSDSFISCIILIVAAVPEGLPTIVAMSLALNMIKLAKGNALIKKMTATETTGAVSVICSDKTGTLTENKMSVVKLCHNQFCVTPDRIKGEHLFQNFICNSTADIIIKDGKETFKGSGTECALIKAFIKSNKNISYIQYRNRFRVIDREPFSSSSKIMSTTIEEGGRKRKLVKGAPEILLNKCNLTAVQINKLLTEMSAHQKMARRIICFAHIDYTDTLTDKYIYDGYVSIEDPIRKEVYQSVKDCKMAGIEVKILTGDNIVTAYAVAKELGIVTDISQVANANDLETLDDIQFKKAIRRIKVIARSTPIIKLKVVKALKSMGEVVAVTGDGINDAPAIKNADVGIAMGVSGSEITKEAADIVLLNDSFSTVVKAVAFGRNVYKNLQRFILFQLSVNLSALFFIVLCAVFNLKSPFNTLQLLWINVIMDGPPALTLGLEQANRKLMNNKPVKRSDNIVNTKMMLRILFNGLFVGTIMILQYTTNFLRVKDYEQMNVIFTLFILFQLFNAFNCRELGSESIFKNLNKNLVMVFTFIFVFLLHIFIVQVCYKFFNVYPMGIISWLKTILMATTIIIISESYKLIYRFIKENFNYPKRKTIKNNISL